MAPAAVPSDSANDRKGCSIRFHLAMSKGSKRSLCGRTCHRGHCPKWVSSGSPNTGHLYLLAWCQKVIRSPKKTSIKSTACFVAHSTQGDFDWVLQVMPLSVVAVEMLAGLERIFGAAIRALGLAGVADVQVHLGMAVPDLHVGFGIRAKDTALGVQVLGQQFDRLIAHVISIQYRCRGGAGRCSAAGQTQPIRPWSASAHISDCVR